MAKPGKHTQSLKSTGGLVFDRFLTSSNFNMFDFKFLSCTRWRRLFRALFLKSLRDFEETFIFSNVLPEYSMSCLCFSVRFQIAPKIPQTIDVNILVS
jgi:hypothetical protein